jgi:thioesterase domain-containing protein
MTTQPIAGSPADAADLCAVPFQSVDRPTLWYVHEISGTVRHFAPLARRLAAHRNVIGLQSVGLNPGYEADTTIEQMAERYLDVIERRGDGAPYDLIGYSMGGLVAFEMAARLADAGREVRLLGLIDSPAPGASASIDLAWAIRMMARTLKAESVLAAQTQDPDTLITLLIDEGRAAHVLPADYTAQDLRPALELQLANGRAAQLYRPAGRYPGDVRLLGAGPGVLAAKTQGWQPYVAGKILGQEIDADHFALMQPPAAATVAGAIEHWLAELGHSDMETRIRRAPV